MAVRILHCGISQENYHICATENIVGFSKNVVSLGDLIYIAVGINRRTFCGVRGIVAKPSERRPWEYSEEYPYVYEIENVEYCRPIELNALTSVGGRYWHLKYMQSSKEIKDKEAIELLDNLFKKNKAEEYQALGE